jgi:hypothetical protein
MRATLDEQCVITASDQFWQQMLSMNLDTLPTADQFCVGSGHILGAVDLSGVWRGRIEVRLAPGLATCATAAMLMLPEDAVAEADTLDAIKEIANMIAGVIKSSLPRPCSMAVPQSAVEPRGYCSPPRTPDTLSVAFRHSAGDLLVRIWEQEYVV